jgi:hypothetical protein
MVASSDAERLREFLKLLALRLNSIGNAKDAVPVAFDVAVGFFLPHVGICDHV